MESTQIASSLTRIEQRLSSLEVIEGRLAALEQKVEAIIAPPRALKKRDAARLLGVGLTTLENLLRQGKLRTVPIGDREHVPMSELVRMTSVTTKPQRPASGPALGARKQDGRSEAEKIREFARSLKRNR